MENMRVVLMCVGFGFNIVGGLLLLNGRRRLAGNDIAIGKLRIMTAMGISFIGTLGVIIASV